MSTPHAKCQKVDKEKEDNPIAPGFQSFVPDGDVVFGVNNDTRVCVHSAVMKGASRVFATMFGPNFMEGQDLAAAANTETDPFEIPLPEEESSICLGWICRALHFQSTTMLWNPTSAEIVKVWFHHQQISGLWPWHACSMKLDFLQTVTRKLLRAEGSFLTSASETEKLVKNSMLVRYLYRLATKLQEVRADAQTKVAGLEYKELPYLFGSNNCPNNCHTETTAYFDYLIELTHESGYGICFLGPEAPLSRIDDVLSELDNWLSLHGTVHGGSCENCTAVHDDLLEEISNAAHIINGLCLGCFEGDNTCPEHKK